MPVAALSQSRLHIRRSVLWLQSRSAAAMRRHISGRLGLECESAGRSRSWSSHRLRGDRRCLSLRTAVILALGAQLSSLDGAARGERAGGRCACIESTPAPIVAISTPHVATPVPSTSYSEMSRARSRLAGGVTRWWPMCAPLLGQRMSHG